MINLSHSSAVFTGGNYTQVNNIQQKKGPWDLLQASVAPSAFHDSGDIFDAPKCHPNTRVAIMNALRDFGLRRGNAGHSRILWLNGGAGAGKSAIARSLCEEFSATNSLVASFFFNRSDPSRNDLKSFVATITYQIYGSVPPHYQSLILDDIENDPLVFTRSVDTQIAALIVAPLRDLFVNGHFSDIGKRLIVVDGLDECSFSNAQLNILTAIQKIVNQSHIPFIFLVASRPENALQSFFRSPNIVPLLHQLTLNNSYDAYKDVERFLRDKLKETRETHPFKESIPREWPPNESIQILVQKSSGQFIYALLAVKYITSNRHHPPKRLEVLLELRPPTGDLPFAELDAVYLHILSSAEGDIDLALRLIGYERVSMQFSTVEDLAGITQLDSDDCLASFCDLWSVLSLPTVDGKHNIRISHKSFTDFLYDRSRSGKYYINKIQVHSEFMGKCFRYISEVTYTFESHDRRRHIINFLANNSNLNKLVDNISSTHRDLMSFSAIKCHNTFASPTSRSEDEQFTFNDVFWNDLFFKLLEMLRTLVGTDYAYVYDHHLGEFRELTIRHPDIYSPSLMLVGHATNFSIDKASVMITGLILTGQFGSEAPLKFLQSAHIDFLSPKTLEIAWDTNWFSKQSESKLIHDAVVKCLEFIQYDVNLTSVAATLKYLAWALPRAAYSVELDEACGTHETTILHFMEGDHSTELFNVVQGTISAMQHYSRKWIMSQYFQNGNNTNISNTSVYAPEWGSTGGNGYHSW